MGSITANSQWLLYSGQTTDERSGGIATFSNGDIATAYSVSRSDGSNSVFVERLSTEGNILWSIDINADYLPYAVSVLIDKNDTVYVIGGTKTGASGESGKNDRDVYAAAISGAGEKIWYKNYGAGIHESGATAALDGDSNIILIGRVSEVNDAYSFIKDVPNFYDAEFTGGWRGFQLKINPANGEIIKAYTTGSFNSGGELIAVDQSRNIAFVSGYTFGAVNGVSKIGGGDPNGANTYLIARNETTGSVLWTRMENWVRSNIVVQEEEDAIYFVDKGVLEKIKGSTGETQWSKSIANTHYVLSPFIEGGILIAERKSTGSLGISRYDADGNEAGSQVINHTGDLDLRLLIENGNGTLQVSGTTNGDISAPSGTSFRNSRSTGLDAFVVQLESTFSEASSAAPAIIRGNSLYTIVDGPSWTQAEANSVKLGGNLVTIEGQHELEAIWNLYRHTYNSNDYGLWTGLNDAGAEGVFEWSSGSNSKWLETNYRGKDSWWETTTDQDFIVIRDGNVDDYWAANRGPQWGTVVLEGIAEIPFIRRGDSAYVIVEGPTWEEAEANAVALGGHLVTINDAEEDKFLSSNFSLGSWIGLTDKDSEGTFKWISGERYSYSNWSPGEPNNSNGDQDYGWYHRGYNGKWDDTRGDGTWGVMDPITTGIAEIKLAPNNTPTGTPTITGDLKAGSTLTIDASAIQDANNFAGYTPTYQYAWESSTDGTTWNNLTTPDATDENNTYTLTTAEVGKQIRGVVSYVDGYGSNETLSSDASVKIEAQIKQPIIRGNSLYTIVDGPSWTQAEANSVKLGGHLATISSKDENDYLAKTIAQNLESRSFPGRVAFFGLNDQKNEGKYVLPSGAEANYFNWAQGEPNNGAGDIEEDTTVIHLDAVKYGTAGVWNDVPNTYSESNIGIAEIPFIRRGDSAYVIVEGPTWEEAEANAVALGGHLVTINDEEENEWISTEMRAEIINRYSLEFGYGPKSNSAEEWRYNPLIGYSDNTLEGNWGWADNSDSDYTDWFPSEPNSSTSNSDYAVMYLFGYNASDPTGQDTRGKWDDTSGGAIGIAEIELAPNSDPTGTPTISGDLKAGSTLTIDTSTIEDADNHEYWTPTSQYTWEIANDPGLTQVMPIWELLTTADATDDDENLEITDDLTGKHIRGAVSYVDGYGTNETVYSSEAKVEASDPTQRLISLPSDLTAKVGQIIEVPITINQAQDLQALDLNFAFDPELFTVPTAGGLVRAGSLTTSWTFTGNLNTSTNTLKVSGFSSESLGDVSGDLAYLRLMVKGTAPRGEAVLDVISASLNENTLAVELQDGSLTITASTVSIASDLKAPVGGSIGIPITIDDASDLQSIDLVFAYDPTIFSLPASGEIISGSDLTGNWSFAANTATPGEIKISGFGTTPLEGGGGGLVNLNLKINSGIDTGNVLLDLVSASFNEGAITADLIDGTLELLPPTFQVLDVRQTASGLALKLSEAPDLEKLNLYDGQDESIDLPDLRLTRSDGTAVEDLSLHWKAETSELYVIHTDSLTGINQSQFASGASPFQSDLLAAGDYTLAIDARSDGLVSASSGELIDGNGDGITGDAFSYSFTKRIPENLISIADTARGAGQSLGLNGIAYANGINGLPVLVSTSAAIRSLRGTVTYDAAAFNNAYLEIGRDLPDDWTLETQEDVIGSLNYTASGTTAITGTDQELFRFDAVVSQDAPYGASTLIEATVEAPEDPTLTFGFDPSLVALAYSGDTTGNGGHSSLDASRIQRVVVGLDSGFDDYDILAPTLIGDTTGNSGLSSLDASRVQQEVVGLTVDSFPGLPASIV